MSWTPQKTWTSEVLTASDLNTYLRDDMEYLKAIADGVAFSGVQLTRNAATSIADSSSTPITWTAEAFDYGGWWSSGTDVIVPAGAIPSGFSTIAMLFIIRTTFASNGTGGRRINVFVNGSSIGGQYGPALSGDTTIMSYQDFSVVSAGDVITMEVYQSSSGNLNVTDTQITAVRFAPAS